MYIHNHSSKLLGVFTDKLRGGDKISPFLFVGDLGSGRFYSHIEFIRGVECEKYRPFENLGGVYDESCGCFVCSKINKFQSEDLLITDGTESMREFQERIFEFVEHMPVELKNKYLILRNLEMYSSNTLNTFLKVLEEPYKNLVIQTTASEIKYIPKAILSRLKIFRMSFDFKLLRGPKFDPYKGIVGEYEFKSLTELQMYAKYSFKKRAEEIFRSGPVETVNIVRGLLDGFDKDVFRKELIIDLFLRYYIDYYKSNINNECQSSFRAILRNYDKSLFRYLKSPINYYYMNVDNQIISLFLSMMLLKKLGSNV